MFDIVIPLGPNEIYSVQRQIEYTKRNVIGHRNIYIITQKQYIPLLHIQVPDCILVDENIFPFKMSDVANYFGKHHGKCNRNGWYLQQLLKMYASIVIQELSDNYLVLDADVYFLKPTEFLSPDNKPIFTTSSEYHKPYFEHMKRMNPTFTRQTDVSGISHHMMMNRTILLELFSKFNQPFWRVFIECVQEHLNVQPHVLESGASEYELYFNYMLLHHKNKMVVRTLHWSNMHPSYDILTNSRHFDYVSLCSWMK